MHIAHLDGTHVVCERALPAYVALAGAACAPVKLDGGEDVAYSGHRDWRERERGGRQLV
jgi:hypothetical protein